MFTVSSQRALGPCAGEPCSGHGRCLETRSVSGQPARLCLCDHGWTGTNCDLTGKKRQALFSKSIIKLRHRFRKF
ncbi:semaphorin-5b-like [Plakobranchus ocellatus]|uniref:Semaphorin-5b-like n=1 Tax=Plakobranchus ocellatus TaxID=259542 RepID=A0AAV3ZS49_9GAST|nr:semaphorin-5b-like [Plakobranchus ocellatus]